MLVNCSLFHFCLQLKPHLNYGAVSCNILFIIISTYCDYYCYYYLKANAAMAGNSATVQVLWSELHFHELILYDLNDIYFK
jgi:hypothetical protein